MPASVLLKKIESLPPLPGVCARLSGLMEDPRCSVKEVAKLILQDPSLTSELLRLANSAWFSISGGVGSVERAVQMLGFSAVQQLVLCAMSAQLLERQASQAPNWLSMHSQAVALLSDQLAAEANVPSREVALAAGLLHDVGQLALYLVEPALFRAYGEKVRAGAPHCLDLEEEHFGADHEQVGQWLAVHWRYPPALIEVIAHHHSPLPGAAALTDLVAVADGWVWSLTPSESRFRESLDPVRAARVGLPVTPPADRLDSIRALLEPEGAAR